MNILTCQTCTNDFEGKYEKYCSQTCRSIGEKAARHRVEICPTCNKELFGKWNYHKSICGKGVKVESDYLAFCIVDFRKCKNESCTENVLLHRRQSSEYCSKKCRSVGRSLYPKVTPARSAAGRKAAKMNGSGYKPGSGIGKHGWYKGYWCDSSYELAYVMYNIDNNIPFKQNIDRFPYKYNDKNYSYTPDFIAEDGSYIEIKGFETEKDHAKWSQFPHKLTVLRKTDLTLHLEHAKVTYGPNYISLYGRVK